MTVHVNGQMNGRTKTLMSGLGFGESPRWHDGRLWFCNWGTQEIVAVDLAGRSKVAAHVPTTIPYSIDWLPDGRLLVVSGPEGKLLRLEADGSWVTHADLAQPGTGGWNEIVVDGRGNTYVNGPGIALIAADGATRFFAEQLGFPNGMAVTADNSTLIVAESHGKRLTAFDIAEDGALSGRRVWADLAGSGVSGVPDGICLDAAGAVWYADVPNKRCVRVREGGEVLETVEVDRGCFSCTLGGTERKTLFIVAAEWLGWARMAEALAARSGQLLSTEISIAGAGWP
jgi:sugar lactone lactonase YvrE